MLAGMAGILHYVRHLTKQRSYSHSPGLLSFLTFQPSGTLLKITKLSVADTKHSYTIRNRKTAALVFPLSIIAVADDKFVFACYN